MRKLGAILIILGIVVLADYFYALYYIPPALDFNSLLLTDMNGAPVSLAAMKGKRLLINFFDPKDDSCTQKMPMVEKAQVALNKDNFLFLVISDGPLKQLDSLRQETGGHLLFLRSTTRLSELNIRTLPATYILNPNGELVYRKTGVRDWTNDNTLREFKMAK